MKLKKINFKSFKKEEIKQFKDIKVVTAEGKFVELSTGVRAYAVVACDKTNNSLMIVVGKKFHSLRRAVQIAILAQEFYKEGLSTVPVENLLDIFIKDTANGINDVTCRFNQSLAAELAVLTEFPNKAALNSAKRKVNRVYNKSVKPMYAAVSKDAKTAIKAANKSAKVAAKEASDIENDESLTLNAVSTVQA